MAFDRHLTRQQLRRVSNNLRTWLEARYVRHWTASVSAALWAVWLAVGRLPAQPPASQLLYAQDFTKASALQEFVFSDPSAWRLGQDKDVPFLELFKASRYQPPFRSPLNLALVAHQRFSDFVLECDCQQTSREYAHRDLVFIFGYQGPDQFYYAHVAAKTDDHANGIFVVDRAPRRKLSGRTNQGNDWGRDVWRRIRLERRVNTGEIKLFFDDWTSAVMTAEDTTFATGWVGLGSFDDTGRFARLRIHGPRAESKKVPPFPTPPPPNRQPSR